MAEPNPPLHPSKLPTPNPQAQQASAKFLSSFLYKVIFFTIIIALLPLFPSQASETTNQSIFTSCWELLHLLIVGIAISYGIFSRRNTEPELEKETAWKADSPRSYISQILHVSSEFDDDEVDSPRGPLDESKIHQTWSSKYYRNNPAVVVKNDAGHATNKPLYLPVRSLKSCAQDSALSDSCNEFIDDGSVNGIEGSRNFDARDSTNEPERISVLPSPIPWRSRSGRMEMKDVESASGTGMAPSPSCSLPPSVLEADFGLSRTPSFRSPATRTPSSTPPNRLSPSPSPSPETRAKSSEDLVRKKSFYKSTPPPAPPPPPPPPFLAHGYSPISDKKVVSKSFKAELEDLSKRGNKGFQSAKGFGPSMSSPKPRNEAESYSVGRSVRTVRAKEVPSAMPYRATKIGAEQSFGYEENQPPLVPRYQAEKNNEFMEKVIISSDDSDTDDVDGESSDKEEIPNSVAEAAPEENEVDKKADEFIAKFREQIRLQRIESIKRSSGQRSPRNQK